MVAQWLRIYLTMQEKGVQPLVWKDSTCCGATKPCTTTTEPTCQTMEAQEPWKPCSATKKPLKREACAPQLESCPCSLQVERSLGSNEGQEQPIKFLIKIKKNPVNIFLSSDGVCLPGKRMFTWYKINGYSECIYFILFLYT